MSRLKPTLASRSRQPRTEPRSCGIQPAHESLFNRRLRILSPAVRTSKPAPSAAVETKNCVRTLESEHESRMRKKADNVATYWSTIGPACKMLGDIDARWGPEHGGAVQLRELRGAGGQGPPVAGNPRDRQCRVGGAVAGIREALRAIGTAVDRAGEAAAGAVAASVLLGAFGAAADGAAGLQLAVSLVCRAGNGRADLGRDGVHEEPRASG